MKWPPWRRRRPHRCRGIRLRISAPGGELVNATSEQLYLIAKYGGAGPDDWYEILSPTFDFSGGAPAMIVGDMLAPGLRTNIRVEIQCHVTT